jgi:hypothetical protein
MIYRQPDDYTELIKKHFPVSDYHLDLEVIKHPPPEYIKDFFEKLANHENYNQLKDNFLYDEKLNVFIHVHNKFPHTELSGLTEEQTFFYPFMDKKEIKQIFEIKSASDFLLRLRAEQVENDMRLRRTFSKLKKKIGKKWSFTNYFDSKQYKEYLNNLKQNRKEICQDIPHGTIHFNEANGMCLKTPFGNIIVLSYGLRHFLFYMNVFFFGKNLGVKEIDITHSFLLAIRIMIGTESLDFEIDSRGRLPKSIRRQIDFLTDWQMRFIIGHEYAHHYLGHLDKRLVLKSHDRVKYGGNKVQYYTYEQKNEFEADLHSVIESTYPDVDKSELINGAFMVFIFFSMYDKVVNYMFPGRVNSSHPEPLDRLTTLRATVDSNTGLKTNQLNAIIASTERTMDEFLKEYLPFNVDKIEMEGSIYLPSYRKKILIDRLDI